MSQSGPVERVVALLTSEDYVELEQPIDVAGIPFEFDSMLISDRSLDLIAVVDTVSTDPTSIRRQVEGLARALDLGRSRRPLTVILVGPPPGIPVTHALARVCRVLVAGTPTGTDASEELTDALAVLLSLRLPVGNGESPDSWADARIKLLAAYSDEGSIAVLEASTSGAESVTEALRRMLAAPFDLDRGAE